MPILLGLLSAAAFWYFRMRDVGRAAQEVIDAAQRVRGAYRRKRFCDKAESAPIASVEDPAAAAVAMLIALASARGALSRAAEAAIKEDMRRTMSLPNAEETFIFARWVADHTHDPNDLSRRFSKIWMRTLQHSERADLYEMASRVAAADGSPWICRSAA